MSCYCFNDGKHNPKTIEWSYRHDVNIHYTTASDTKLRSSNIQYAIELTPVGCRMKSLQLSRDLQRKLSLPNSHKE